MICLNDRNNDTIILKNNFNYTHIKHKIIDSLSFRYILVGIDMGMKMLI